MKNKQPTDSQGKWVVQTARAKGVSLEEFQAAQDDGSFGRYIESLKGRKVRGYVPISEARIAELTELATKVGARIHILRRVRIKRDCEWQEAVNTAGLNTPEHYNVRKVGSLYLPNGMGEVEKDLVMLNYPQGGSWDKALAWGQAAKLKKTVPREVFAVGGQFPTLYNNLGTDQMYTVATTECLFEGSRQACFVWWVVSGREAGLLWVSYFGVALVWFVFSE